MTIDDIAFEFDRLFPTDVDATPVDWGHGTEAGYIGRRKTDEQIIGYYTNGGNVGHPVMAINNEDISLAGAILAGMESADDLADIEHAFASAGVRFERLA